MLYVMIPYTFKEHHYIWINWVSNE